MSEMIRGNREQGTGNRVNDYKDLRVWQKGIDVAEKCYKLTKTFPREELSALTNQIRRSANQGNGQRATVGFKSKVKS